MSLTSLPDADILIRKIENEQQKRKSKFEEENAEQYIYFAGFPDMHQQQDLRLDVRSVPSALVPKSMENVIDVIGLRFLISATSTDPKVFERAQQLFSLLCPARLFNETTSYSRWEAHLLLTAPKIRAANNIAPPALRGNGLLRAGSAMHTQMRSVAKRKTQRQGSAAINSGRTHGIS